MANSTRKPLPPVRSRFGQMTHFLFTTLPLRCKRMLQGIWQDCKNFLAARWKKLKPFIDKATEWGIAFGSATETLKLSIQIIPIVLSVLTVLTAVPLFQFLLPNLLFEPLIIVPLILGVSIFAGYHKYKELVLRAELDHQIKLNKRENRELTRKVALMEETLNNMIAPKKVVKPLSRKLPQAPKCVEIPVSQTPLHPSGYFLRARKQSQPASKSIMKPQQAQRKRQQKRS